MQEERRKTWKQNRDLKRKMKVDRKFFDRSKDKPEPAHRQPRGHRAANGQVRPRKSRLPLSELIKRTRCRNCNQKGHWSRECPARNGHGATAAAAAH
eukprot:7069525-Pyramimonas_sp.AAC.1